MRVARRWTYAELAKIREGSVSKTGDARSNRHQIVHLVIPFPPSTNHDKAPDGKGGHYLLPATVAFREAVCAAALQARSPWVDGKSLTVAITLYPPDQRAYDIDNRIKPTLDALQAAGVIANDRAVKRLVIAEAYIKDGGEAAVSVEGDPVEPEQAFR